MLRQFLSGFYPIIINKSYEQLLIFLFDKLNIFLPEKQIKKL